LKFILGLAMKIIVSLLLVFDFVQGTSDQSVFCEDNICTKISHEAVLDPCGDKHVDCSFWASTGECDVNPNYMLNNCAKSCDVCPHVGTENNTVSARSASCFDEEASSECMNRASHGECLLNPEFMEVNCKATCMLCINEEMLRSQGISDDEM